MNSGAQNKPHSWVISHFSFLEVQLSFLIVRLMLFVALRGCSAAYLKSANLLQSLHGLDAFIFWLSAFLWDLCTFTITSVLFIVTLAVFQFDNWSSPAALGATHLLTIRARTPLARSHHKWILIFGIKSNWSSCTMHSNYFKDNSMSTHYTVHIILLV